MNGRFERAIAAIDAYNAQDPQARELTYSRRMTAALERLEPAASEALRLAARAQHIGRWTSPRAGYAMDRAGYKRWREDLASFHAETAAGILREAGYGEEAVARVGSLLRKKNLKTDPECQTLEDAICLVFLEHEFEGFLDKHGAGEEKVLRILRRTWAKMSERGRQAALALKLPERGAALLTKALAG